ncbi:MAG: bifunctional DNA primase/polymerase [Nitrosotalea sp.]
MNRTECITILKEQGLNIIPLKEQSKVPQIQWAKYQDEMFTGEIPDNANLGVICGKTSDNLVVVDLDFNDESVLDEIYPDVKNQTLVVKTNKGYHIYLKAYKLPKTLRLENKNIGRIDVQSSGTYVVSLGSIHPMTKKEYQIISTTTKIAKIDFQQIIEHLEKLGFKTEQNRQSMIEIKNAGVQEGSRNLAMFKVACELLHERKLDEPTAWAELQTINEKNNPPLSNEELRTLFESAKKYGKNDNANESQDLYQFATSKIKRLIISQNNSREVYAVIEINGHIETVELSSARAIQWLNHTYRNCQSPKIRGEDFFKNILTAIISDAQMNNASKEKVYNRIASVDNTVYYDLATQDWKIVKITAQSIDIVPYTESMPIFRRTQSSFEQAKPTFDDSSALDRLAELLRIKDKEVFKVHLTSFLLEGTSVPIMVFDGAAGSMKTTVTATIKRIVDPNGMGTDDNCTSMTNQNDNLIVQLYNRYMSAFDNVTKITQEVSDILCRAITGSGNQKRALYSNSDEAILNFRSKLVLNGIVLNPDFPDLLDRIITYERIPLGENDRLMEQEFQEKFRALLPPVLGQIFTLIQKSLSTHHAVKQEIRPKTRLADFEVWGESIARAMNQGPNVFLNKLYEKQKSNSISIRDTYPIVQAIELLMENKDNYMDSAQKCFNDLRRMACNLEIEPNNKFVKFPKSANRLVPELTMVEPILKKLGYGVSIETYTRNDKKFTKNSKVVTIEKIQNQSSPSSPPSLFDNNEQNKAKNGDSIGESSPEIVETQ